MLTAIVALSVPYIYRQAWTERQIDLSYSTVQQLVQSIEPAAILQDLGRGLETTEFTCLIPRTSANTFIERLRAAVGEHIQKLGWEVIGSGKTILLSTGSVESFSYELANGGSRCTVLFHLIDREEGKDFPNKTDAEELRFIVLSPHITAR